MLDIKKNYEFSRVLASQSMVLLKNDENVLPLTKNDTVGIIGKECFEFISGGGGSAEVKTEYTKNLKQGLKEKENENKIKLSDFSFKMANETENYTVEDLNNLAKKINTAIVTFKRHGCEGYDRKLGPNSAVEIKGPDNNAYGGEDCSAFRTDNETSADCFYPSKEELELFLNIERSNIKNVVLILNISAIVDLSFIDRFKKIKSVLLSYLPGMEGGGAIADILCGDVNPSGKLTDTVAYCYEDYPSAKSFNYYPCKTEYKEDIFVGYRYFETFAKDKVMYPFGYGLSYTEFEYLNCMCDENDEKITIYVDVKNTGNVAGREAVQAYVCPPAGELLKPYIELKGFYKTKLLAPNETEHVRITFDKSDLASFDTYGKTSYKAAFVIEKGEYKLFAGKSVRDLYPCGSVNIKETVNAKQLKLRFDGSKYEFKNNDSHKAVLNEAGFNEVNYNDVNTNKLNTAFGNTELSLYDVAENKISAEDFVSRLGITDLVHLSQGGPPAFAGGTAGVGNIKRYKIPNPQTADGPAGIRRSANTTCFPCGTLIACSWDSKLQFKMGKALGYEGYNTGVDIILAPSMNIHRNPLCGRNFEYFSEDPIVIGNTAACIVKGIQSEKACAVIKHFAVNNCEHNRQDNNSIVSERALREIYLKGFEIVIKKSNPAFLMTSYNLLNGIHTSTNAQLLRGVLRDEWGYTGAVMTDWRTKTSLDDEIIGGNNIKMPFGYPDEAEKAVKAYESGKLSLSILRENAVYVLKAIMKTGSFLNKNFGICHSLDKRIEFSAVEVNGISSTRVHQSTYNNKPYLCNLGKDQRAQRTFAYYVVDSKHSGKFKITCRVATNRPKAEIWILNGSENKLGKMVLDEYADENRWYDISTEIELIEGENILKLIFAAEPQKDYGFSNNWFETSEDIKILSITIEKL